MSIAQGMIRVFSEVVIWMMEVSVKGNKTEEFWIVGDSDIGKRRGRERERAREGVRDGMLKPRVRRLSWSPATH